MSIVVVRSSMTANFLLILVSAFLVGAAATPLARRLALSLDMIDRPGGRHRHQRAVPLLGGVAIYAAVMLPVLLYVERFELRQLVAISLGASIVSLVGLWDDRAGLGAMTKLAVPALAAVVLFVSGVRVRLPVPEAVDFALSVGWVVVVTHAFNLIDNEDGHCSGVAAVASAFFLLLAVLNGQYLVGALASAVFGAASAFFLYNRRPAVIFLGDAGSLLVGFLIAALALKLRFPGRPNTITWMVPVLVLGVPLFDAALVTLSRLRRGLNPATTPGTDHTSHRLSRVGWFGGSSLAPLLVAGGLLGAAGVAVSVVDAALAYALAAAVLLMALVLAARLDRTELLHDR